MVISYCHTIIIVNAAGGAIYTYNSTLWAYANDIFGSNLAYTGSEVSVSNYSIVSLCSNVNLS